MDSCVHTCTMPSSWQSHIHALTFLFCECIRLFVNVLGYCSHDYAAIALARVSTANLNQHHFGARLELRMLLCNRRDDVHMQVQKYSSSMLVCTCLSRCSETNAAKPSTSCCLQFAAGMMDCMTLIAYITSAASPAIPWHCTALLLVNRMSNTLVVQSCIRCAKDCYAWHCAYLLCWPVSATMRPFVFCQNSRDLVQAYQPPASH